MVCISDEPIFPLEIRKPNLINVWRKFVQTWLVFESEMRLGKTSTLPISLGRFSSLHAKSSMH